MIILTNSCLPCIKETLVILGCLDTLWVLPLGKTISHCEEPREKSLVALAGEEKATILKYVWSIVMNKSLLSMEKTLAQPCLTQWKRPLCTTSLLQAS